MLSISGNFLSKNTADMSHVDRVGRGKGSVTQSNAVQGTYRGQIVVNPMTDAPSLIDLAAELSGFQLTSQQQRKNLLERQVISQKTFKEKEKVLLHYTSRLGQERESKKYKESYQALQRLQYKEEYKENPKKLCETILHDIAGAFGEVTEQDNLIEYALATNAIDRQRIQNEIEQVSKMIEVFSNPEGQNINVGFANSERIKWTDKLNALQDNLQTNQLLHDQLTEAQTSLKTLHRQEIRDGYNLIPKALSIIEQYGQDMQESAISLAIAYRDEVLTMKTPLEVFEVFFERQKNKRESFRPYIDSMIALFGCDMSSANPSRSKEELYGVRDSLFRVEICGQTFDNVGVLGKNIRKMFLSNDENMPDKEQLAATQELVRLTQGAFVSSQQIAHLLDFFFEGHKDRLEISIYRLNPVIELVRALPEKFFKDDQSQGQFITSAQKSLDDYILKEEELAGQAYLMEGK